MANQRLDNQRAPKRFHARTNRRDYWRGYTVLPHAPWGDPRTTGGGPGDGREAASNGMVFTDPNITAQDTSNALKLAGLGFVASPQTAWTSGQKITVSGFLFGWTGAVWAPGARP